MTITVMIAEDEALVRSGCAVLLSAETKIKVVGEAVDGQQAIGMARSLRPDVVLMDLRMPVLDGIAATRAITTPATDTTMTPRVLILTSFNEEHLVRAALAAGASGFLLKQAAPADLITAVEHCAAGEGWLDPAVVGRVLSSFRGPGVPAQISPELVASLTPRELEVLTLMAQGRSNAEISALLHISQATTRTHVGHVITKTGSRDRTQAVVVAYRSGIMSQPHVIKGA